MAKSNNIKFKRKLNINRLFVILEIMLLLIVFATIVFGYYQNKKATQLAKEDYLNNTSIYASLFENALNLKIESLNKVANTLSVDFEEAEDLDSIKKTLHILSMTDDFDSYLYVTSDGNIYCENGLIFDEFLYEPTINGALEGNSLVSKALYPSKIYGDVLIFASPLSTKDGKEAIVGLLSKESLCNLAHLDNDNNQYFAIIDSEGQTIIHSKNNTDKLITGNLFVYLRQSVLSKQTSDAVIENIKQGNSDMFQFNGRNRNRFVFYYPISINNFTLVSCIENKDFYTYSKSMNEYMIGLGILLFAIAIYISHQFSFLFNFTKDIEEKSTRRKIMDAENDSIAFTYYPLTGNAEFSGAVEQTFGNEIKESTEVNWSRIVTLLHPDDQGIMRSISKAIHNGEIKHTTEFRIKHDDTYIWYRLRGKAILSKSNEIEKFVGIIENSNDQISHENMLKSKAEHDLLTGLINKITIEETVNQVIKDNPNNIFAFYIIDLDNFKAVNDHLGHATGDKVLIDIAGRLQLIFTEYDYIGRLGGDEFCVLLNIPANMKSQATKLIMNKAKALNENLIVEYGNEEITIKVSASIGICKYPDNGDSFQILYTKADKALYFSKENGKNRYTYYDDIHD